MSQTPAERSDSLHAANPYGCNQHRHGEGCPHANGGVDPDLKKNLEAALRRARRKDGTVEQDGELSRTHEVRLREMPEVMKALGEPDVPLVMTVHHIRKLASKHGLTVEQMEEVAAKLNDPLLVMQADVQKHLLLLDMEAYEKQDKAMRPVICFVEKKPDKEHAEYVVSAYPLQKEKYRKVTGQVKSLLYSKFRDEKTAQFAADAPQCSEARDLLRAAIRSGFADSVLTGEELVKRKDSVSAANPYGCNQYRHGEGCEDYTGQTNKNELQHEQRDEQRGDTRPGGEAPDRGRSQETREGVGRVGSPWRFDAVADRVARAAPEGASEESIRECAETTTAQLNAVLAGRKPAFLETDPELVRPFAQDLPPGLHYAEAGHSACIYHAAAAARELGIPEGKELHEAVRTAVESGDCGLLLGYGAPSIYTRPSHGVSIMRNGEVFYRFNSSANEATAEHYARERQRDFEIAFPDDKWESKIDRRPGSDGIHAANPYGCKLKDGKTAQLPAERAATFALAAYTAPAVAELQHWLRQGLTLRQMAERIPTLRFNTRVLATLLHHTYATALLPPADAREAEADAVLLILDTIDTLLPTRRTADSTAAANPHGCNQYRHAPGCTHYTGQTNQNELQHELQHEQPHTRPADQPARPRDLLRQGGEENGLDEKSGDPRERPGAGVQPTRPDPHDDSGGAGKDVQRDGYRIGISEAHSRLHETLRDITSEEASRIVDATTAQLNAVYDGRKPAYMETNAALVRPFAQELPQGLHYVEAGHSACIYHEAAAARELGVPAGETLHEAVRTAVESGDCGLLLGYGAPSILTRPSNQVLISRNGDPFYSFNSAADVSTAEHYAKERELDFARQFPTDEWCHHLIYRPGSDSLHAANPYGCKFRDEKTAKFAADAPKSNKASELLRAAIDGGFAYSVLTGEELVKRKDSTTAANPHGCNQYRHAPGCTHYTGQTTQNELQHEHDSITRPDISQAPGSRDLPRLGGASDRADEQGRDPGERPGAGVQPVRPMRDDDSGGEPPGSRGVGGQWRFDAVASRLIPSYQGVAQELMLTQAAVTTAQLNAVLAGRKPAFLETDPELVRPFAQDLPPGLHYAEAGHSACIYHAAAAARELGVPVGDALHEAVRTAVESGDCGLLLGYGAPSISTRPSHGVSIMRNGVEYYGFNSSADKNAADHYARERQRDFEIAFPDDKWESKLKYHPGSDSLHAANPYGCKLKDEKTAQLPAVAPQCPEARELVLAAMKNGFRDSVLTGEELVKRKKSRRVSAAAADDYRKYVPELEVDATDRTAEEWAELEPEARVGKFFTARVADERLLLALQDLVARCLEEGVSEAEFVRRAKLMLESMPRPDGKGNYSEPARRMEEMTPEERLAYENDVRHLDSRARLKLIYRTQSAMAAGYRQWKKALARLDRYPAWLFVRQPGARIKRPDHVAHENEVRLITDIRYWLARNSPDQGGFNVPYPPFGYNSWMLVEQVSRKEAEKLGLLKKGEKVTIPPEMARYDMRTAVEQSNSASMDGLPEEAKQRVIEACREEGIELHPAPDGSTRPVPSAPPPPPPTPDPLNVLEVINEIDTLLAETETLLSGI